MILGSSVVSAGVTGLILGHDLYTTLIQSVPGAVLIGLFASEILHWSIGRPPTQGTPAGGYITDQKFQGDMSEKRQSALRI